MNFVKSYIVQLVLAISFVITMKVMFINNQPIPKANNGVVSYNNNWSIETDGKEDNAGKENVYEELPKSIKRNDMSEIRLTKILPINILEGDTIGFYSSHQSIKVYIDNRLVYLFAPDSNMNSKTPGSGWHFIDLGGKNEEKVIEIIITPSYKSTTNDIPKFYYGENENLIIKLLKEDSLSILTCIYIFFMGLLIVIYVVAFRKEKNTPKFFIWLGFCFIMISIWSFTSVPFFTVLFNNHLIASQVNMISLKLVTLPIIMFSMYTYNIKKNYMIKGFCLVSIIDSIASMILQILGILDLKETMIFTFSIFVIGMTWILCLVISDFIKHKGRNYKSFKKHNIYLCFILLTLGIDLFNYYIIKDLDMSKFTRVGVLLYIFVLMYITFNNSAKAMSSTDAVERIQELAKTDAITKLSNRIAFEEDVSSIDPSEYLDYGIVIFDLNNLKRFNDLHGHSMGDYYIIISSEIIQDVFGKYGKVYRIGGDEFCAIIKKTQKSVYKDLEEKMNKRIAELNGAFFESKMSIASGFANFKEDDDMSIHDTFQRADMKMYENKKRMKTIKNN